ncbi:hypothetical protein V1318_03385 [Lysobacter sp. CCNWLW3]|uniref:hypothetical protein n=1 Tax=unclassified Lysobacter TaxID=2635362 RepID=UPI002FCF96A4
MKIFLLISWLLASSCAVASDLANALPAEATQALHSTGHAVIYSLEPWADPDKNVVRLQGYQILGRSDLSDAQRSIAVGAFDSALAGWEGAIAACFDPRHALRIQFEGHAYDFLLCYSCQQVEVFRDGKMIGGAGITGSPEVLNDLMTSLQLPLSHSLEDMEKGQQAEIARIEAGQKRFLAAMPPSIKPFWDADANLQSGIPPLPMADLRAAFTSANPDRDAAIRVLLVWFGSGTGRWSGFPGYEDIAGQLLLDYPTDRIVAVAQAADTSEALLEGAARYFAGWGFSKRHPLDIALVPASLKQRLLEHTLRTGDVDDEDRRDRAKHAFAK